jgi:predicted Abi (CAAX) family protease
MRAVINGLALTSALVAALLALNLLLGFAGGAYDATVGPSTATQQLIAIVAAVLAIAFGFAGRFQDRRVPKPASRFSNTTIAVGLISALLVLALPFVFA